MNTENDAAYPYSCECIIIATAVPPQLHRACAGIDQCLCVHARDYAASIFTWRDTAWTYGGATTVIRANYN